MSPNIRSAFFAIFCAAIICETRSLNYSDLEALGVNCPEKDSCRGYSNNLTYMDRSCECDSNCTAYKDCCIDALLNQEDQNSRPAARTDVTCLKYGEDFNSGVYVVSKCSNGWNGPRKVREKCMGSVDFRDPVSSTPVTDIARKESYRNLACAECNNANLESLTHFRLKLRCSGTEDATQDQIIADLLYNNERSSWGVNRLNRFGNATEFFACSIIFDVPEYLNNSVRFCRANLISKCADDWNRPTVARQCAEYMAAIYSNDGDYRNPHCAICNHKTVDEISCRKNLLSRNKPNVYRNIVDINPDSNMTSTPQCPSGRKYDPFFKRCRRLVCAIPGTVLVDGNCVNGG